MSIMRKFSVTYVKQHPVMFGAIFLVFGLLLWMLFNKSAANDAANSSGTTVVQAGPSDAQIAAGVQLQEAQLAANTQIGLAQISLAANSANNDSQERLAALALQGHVTDVQAQYNLGEQQITASVQSLAMQLQNNLQTTDSNNSFMLNYAKNAADAATAQLMVGADLQKSLSADQLEAFKFSSLASVIPTLKEGKRDNAFSLLTTDTYGGGTDAAGAAQIMAPNGSHNSHIGSILATLAPVAIAFA